MRKRSWDMRSLAMAGLFVMALFYTLHVARAFFLPATLAVLLGFLFNPMVRWLHRLHVPLPAGAALVLAALLAALVCGALLLSAPAEEWLIKAPKRCDSWRCGCGMCCSRRPSSARRRNRRSK